MNIKKRNGSLVPFNPNKILTRLKSTAKKLKVDCDNITIEVQTLLRDGISTKEIDEEIARICAGYSVDHDDYSILAARITASRLQKELGTGIESWKNRLDGYIDPSVFEKQEKWGVEPNYDYDFTFDYMGISSFITVYGIKKDKKHLIELPCEMMFRVSLFLSESKEEFLERYEDYTTREYGTATPTLMNGGTHESTMISCSVNELMDDSLEGIHDTMKSISQMSKSGAGIGLWAGNLRSQESQYNLNKGKAGGIVRFGKIVNENLRFFKQNEDRRGKAAMYLNIWHKDIFSFLDLTKKEGSEETTARDLMIAVCINDLFYKRLLENETWSTFCPHEIKKVKGYNLYDYYGEEFEARYLDCEADERISRLVYSSKELIEKICNIQAESGVPYILNIDTVNRHNNQKNYGIIKTSQLCIEIVQYTSDDVSAQCALGSIPLNKFHKNGKIDYDGIRKSASKLNYTINRIIDKNKWVNQYSYNGGVNQRATAMGICGLADLFYTLKIPFESEEALEANERIFENMYYGAIEGSIKYRKENKIEKSVCDLLDNTNVGKGIFVFETYDEEVKTTLDWDSLREKVLKYGVANSMFIGNMPTASTSQLNGANEMFEPVQDLTMLRRTISGSFAMINKYMIKDLEEKGIQITEDLLTEIKVKGSLKDIDLTEYTDDMEWITNFKNLYKTIWEIPQKTLIDLCAKRQRFIDQSQSLNLYWANPTLSKLVNSLIYGWKKGLKTGVYYTKTKTATSSDKSLAFDIKSKEVLKEKPKDSPFECFGCSA